MSFASTLLKWYSINKRDLPWRHTTDPYKIWLSEIIMQQTRVEQGLPYYERFIGKYPYLKLLAVADEDHILKLWQGLGYYSRARNLLSAARQMMELHKGFPDTYPEILNLKGIGDYTASAIASFAFNLPHAVVDGNVFRFLARHFGVRTPIDGNTGKKEFKSLAQELLDIKNPGLFNQAMMEFGALQCKPQAPLCQTCPFNQTCFARINNCISQLPVKGKSTVVRTRYFHYLVIHYNNKTFIRQRQQKDIWKGLFEFPLIETVRNGSFNTLKKTPHFNDILSNDQWEFISHSELIRHQLSHQLLVTRFYHIKVRKNTSGYLKNNCLRIHEDQLNNFAFPQLIARYLQIK